MLPRPFRACGSGIGRGMAAPRAKKVVLLAGGLGGARLAPALRDRLPPRSLTVIANVGDDLEWTGLRVSPDLDSITYALAGLWHRARGWGRKDETFCVRDTLAALGASVWFGIGDRDLALHLARAERLAAGRTLTEVTRELAGRLGVGGTDVLPASDRLAPTRVRIRGGRVLAFQEWYVRRGARPAVEEILHGRAPASMAALAALAAADAVVLGPSNPLTSIGAVLALRGMRGAIRAVPRRVAISPVVVRRGRRSAAIAHHAHARRRALASIGLRDRPGSIAALYRGLAQTFLLDASDRVEATCVARAGLEPVTADLLDERALARAVVERLG